MLSIIRESSRLITYIDPTCCSHQHYWNKRQGLQAYVPEGPTHLLEGKPESTPPPSHFQRDMEKVPAIPKDSGFCSCLSTGDQWPWKGTVPWCTRNPPEGWGLPQQLSGDTFDLLTQSAWPAVGAVNSTGATTRHHSQAPGLHSRTFY